MQDLYVLMYDVSKLLSKCFLVLGELNGIVE